VLHFASSRAVKGLFLPGARAIAASTSAWLTGNFLEELFDFIFLGLSKADDVEVVFALGVGHVHDRAKTKLAVCKVRGHVLCAHGKRENPSLNAPLLNVGSFVKLRLIKR
jgi:hypothetical protein